MIPLDDQLVLPDVQPNEMLRKVYEGFGIEERGGGPEGLYYTHPLVNGEYLFRNLNLLIQEVSMHQRL